MQASERASSMWLRRATDLASIAAHTHLWAIAIAIVALAALAAIAIAALSTIINDC